ncbi:unnamed protein product [Rotaria socialis]
MCRDFVRYYKGISFRKIKVFIKLLQWQAVGRSYLLYAEECHDELISKSFQGSQGRAYLFNSVVNVNTSAAEERVLLTGLHEVADIYCDCCKTLLGWKYEHAFETSQKYKEGKFIIELVHMIKDNGWDDENIDQSNYLKK